VTFSVYESHVAWRPEDHPRFIRSLVSVAVYRRHVAWRPEDNPRFLLSIVPVSVCRRHVAWRPENRPPFIRILVLMIGVASLDVVSYSIPRPVLALFGFLRGHRGGMRRDVSVMHGIPSSVVSKSSNYSFRYSKPLHE
jgi:hypothetical protein